MYDLAKTEIMMYMHIFILFALQVLMICMLEGGGGAEFVVTLFTPTKDDHN